MKYVQVSGCSDGHKWYRNYTGHVFVVLEEDDYEYKTRQPDGYINFIAKSDSFVVSDAVLETE